MELDTIHPDPETDEIARPSDYASANQTWVRTTHGFRLTGEVTIIMYHHGQGARWVAVGAGHDRGKIIGESFFREKMFDSPASFRTYCDGILPGPVTYGFLDAAASTRKDSRSSYQ